MNADGVGHEGPVQVFPFSYGGDGNDRMSVTTFAGSFVVSLYDNNTNSTQVAASGCQ